MTSINQEKIGPTKMNPLKSLVGKRIRKNVKFMGEDVVISKLTVHEMNSIQSDAKSIKEGDQDDNMKVLRKVIRTSVEGADELTDEDFNALPFEELTSLSDAIMKYSGLGAEQGK